MKNRFFVCLAIILLFVVPAAEAGGRKNRNLGMPMRGSLPYVTSSYDADRCIVFEEKSVLQILKKTNVYALNEETGTMSRIDISESMDGKVNEAYAYGDSLIVRKAYNAHTHDLWKYSLTGGGSRCLIATGEFDVHSVLTISDNELIVSGLFGTDKAAICRLDRKDLTLEVLADGDTSMRFSNDYSLEYYWKLDTAENYWRMYDAQTKETVVLDIPASEYRLGVGEESYITVMDREENLFIFNRNTGEYSPLDSRYVDWDWVYTYIGDQLLLRQCNERTREVTLYKKV